MEDWRKSLRPRPRARDQEEESPVRPQAQPPGWSRPPPRRRRQPKQVPPLPQRGAHSPAQPAARSLSSRSPQRVGSFLSPLTFAGGSAASPRTPPAATVHTHRLWSRTHSPSLTHTARPRLLSGPHIMRHSHVTCSARARALGARLASWEAGGERRRERRNIIGLLGNEVPLLRAGRAGG